MRAVRVSGGLCPVFSPRGFLVLCFSHLSCGDQRRGFGSVCAGGSEGLKKPRLETQMLKPQHGLAFCLPSKGQEDSLFMSKFHEETVKGN